MEVEVEERKICDKKKKRSRKFTLVEEISLCCSGVVQSFYSWSDHVSGTFTPTPSHTPAPCTCSNQ